MFIWCHKSIFSDVIRLYLVMWQKLLNIYLHYGSTKWLFVIITECIQSTNNITVLCPSRAVWECHCHPRYRMQRSYAEPCQVRIWRRWSACWGGGVGGGRRLSPTALPPSPPPLLPQPRTSGCYTYLSHATHAWTSSTANVCTHTVYHSD